MESLVLCKTQVGLSYSSSLSFCHSHLALKHSYANTSQTSKPLPHWDSYTQTRNRLRAIAGTAPLLKHRVKIVRNKISVRMGDSVAVTPKDKGDLKVFHNGDELAASLADYVAGLSQLAITERGVFSVLLSGGSLMNALRKLTEPPYLNSVDWGRWHVLWADERVVAKDHPDSNYKLAYDNFLSKAFWRAICGLSIKTNCPRTFLQREGKYRDRQYSLVVCRK